MPATPEAGATERQCEIAAYGSSVRSKKRLQSSKQGRRKGVYFASFNL